MNLPNEILMSSIWWISVVAGAGMTTGYFMIIGVLWTLDQVIQGWRGK